MPEQTNNSGWGNWLPVIGGAIGALGNIGQGRKNRKAAQEMNQANIDAQNALNASNQAFSKEMWDMTNSYNSPAQLMERYKQAGLNPHLIYGSQPQASQPMSASTQAPHSELVPARRGFQEATGAAFQMAQNYLATRQQQTQIDNAQKTNDVMDAEILSKNANTANTLANTAKSKYELELANDLREDVLQQATLNTQNLGLQGQKIESDIATSRLGRTLTQEQIKKTAQDILAQAKSIQLMQIQGQNAQADLQTKKLDQKLKQLDINLKEIGIQPSDSPWMRIPAQIFNKFHKMGESINKSRSIHPNQR